jgi:Flp pilus assembly pilin Flp
VSCQKLLRHIWRDDHGFMTFEWVLLLTLLVIGIVAGLTGARDAVIDELGDVAEAVVNIDQSYSVAPFTETCNGQGQPVSAPGFSFQDTPANVERCGRFGFNGQ